MPVQRCTAMATASTMCVPMIAASRYVLCSPAEWCISRISCCADSLSPPILSTANGRCTARMASAAIAQEHLAIHVDEQVGYGTAGRRQATLLTLRLADAITDRIVQQHLDAVMTQLRVRAVDAALAVSTVRSHAHPACIAQSRQRDVTSGRSVVKERSRVSRVGPF